MNKHLNEVFNIIKSYNDEPVPYDIFKWLLGELVLIKVYCAYEDYEFLLDDDEFVQVFTTHEKFSQYYDDSQLEICDFEDSILYLNEEDGCEGIVINPESDNISLSLYDLINFRWDYWEPICYDRKSKHIPKQLKKLKQIKNHELNKYLVEEHDDFDRLFVELLKSKIFALVKSKNEIKDKKGIIDRGDDEYYIDKNGFGHIYSSWDKIKKLDDNVYVTVPIHETYVRYILNNDYEGIILNDEHIFTRKYLILNINDVIAFTQEYPIDDYSNYGLILDDE